mmetsp:Transcript_8638/g.17319  ORF Transcript_8638/g.17319 Transcript_8638/m.17319 type:complete len:478 (-) Transcript_8638:88-1521(-)
MPPPQRRLVEGDLVTVETSDTTLQRGIHVYVVGKVSKAGYVNVSLSEGGEPLLKKKKHPKHFSLPSDSDSKKGLEPLLERKKEEVKEVSPPTHWLELKQPFPMASEHNLLEEDCTFTAESLRELPVREGRNVTWNGKPYTEREFDIMLNKWRKVFPGVAKGKRTAAMESLSYKSKALKELAEWAFEACAKIENDVIDFEKTEVRFRKDRYGNVVGYGKGISNGSITKFDVDHIFPWSRGGLTVPENLEALSSRANSVGKNDKFLQELSKEDLETGLREEQIVCLFKYIKEVKAFEGRMVLRSTSASWRIRNAQKYRDKAISWLKWAPGTGEQLGAHMSISEIGRNKDGSYNGREIFDYLEDWFEGGGAERAGGRGRVSRPPVEIVIAYDEQHVYVEGPPTKDLHHSTAEGEPKFFTGLNMTWEKKHYRWIKRLGCTGPEEERRVLTQKIKERAQSLGCNVRIEKDILPPLVSRGAVE